jgi:hypothetical protein
VGGESQLHGEISMPELPGDLELESRIATDGLDWLKDYRCPTDLRVFKLIHNAEVLRRKREAQQEVLPEDPPAAPTVVKAANTKKGSKKQKAPLSVPAA